MPYITREDGERFVIPSYRDTLSVKKLSLLKREVMLLSTSYGEYITLQKKNVNQYEVAFSPDPGYLLGECVWQHFNRPFDMIYCEAIPNTTEAILVIVKSGSVYLDGSFPIDTIPEELLVFKTQANNFNIYIYGNVPIGERAQDGKFAFDAASVKSFTVLDEPVFPTLESVKAFQLQLIDPVLKAQGIGVFPLKQVAIVILAIGLIWMLYTFITTHKKELPSVIITAVNPYQSYNTNLTSPDPTSEITEIVSKISLLFSIPGWVADSVTYTPGLPGTLVASVRSLGARTDMLYAWASRFGAKVEILPDGAHITLLTFVPKRQPPTTISRTQDVVSNLLDSMSYILPGNVLTITAVTDRKIFTEEEMTLSLDSVSPLTMLIVAQQMKGLPIVLTKVTLSLAGSSISGILTFKVLGN